MILEQQIVMGLSAAAIALIIRALVPTMWLLHKPFSCDLCMSWWSSVALSMWAFFGEYGSLSSVSTLLGSVTVSVLALKGSNRLAQEGSTLPFLEEKGDTAPQKESSP